MLHTWPTANHPDLLILIPTRAQLLALLALPSFGAKHAEQLLEGFGSVRAVTNATPADLDAIPGIKDETIEAMQWVWD